MNIRLLLYTGVVTLSGTVCAAPDPLSTISFGVPAVEDCAEYPDPEARALLIEGEPWQGRPTKFFAYVAMPKGAGAGRKVPGIVLAHGGGGTAYLNWAKTWAARGYAAIMPDNCGAFPERIKENGKSVWKRNPAGGPRGWGRCELGLEDPKDQWPYHAVATLVRSHSYLRSLPEVDADLIGLTGISWGGYLTMLTAATDSRFKFAMPVYACGFYDRMQLYRGTGGASRSTAPAEAVAKWDELFDSCHYAGRMKMPVMWFASSNDFAFPYDLLQETVRLPAEMPRLAIRVRMAHSHGPIGENVPELFEFADQVTRGGPALPEIGEPVVKGSRVSVGFDTFGRRLRRIELNWCADETPTPETFWHTETLPVTYGRLEAEVPAGATRVYFNFVLDTPILPEPYTESVYSSPGVKLERNPLGELLPAPRGLEWTGAKIPAETPVRHVSAAVDGVPAAVADQAYRLEIAADGITVTASGDAGRLYAEKTLAQLRKLSGKTLPVCTIVDYPAFRYRGFMHDTGRNYLPVEMIRETLDFMADYKLNLFHWHLTEYWGWRIESKSVPELNTDAATVRYVGRRYTQREFLDVVDYAAKLGITVLPEIDLPGHSYALRRALGVKDMRDGKVDRAVRAFLDEFTALCPVDRVPMIHLGTDEVRNDEEKVPVALMREWARIAAKRGHRIVGWDPGMDLGIPGDGYAKMGWGAPMNADGHPIFNMWWYIDIVDPFELLSLAVYRRTFDNEAERGYWLGPLIGNWHDDFVGEDFRRLFVNNPVFPAIALNSQNFWRDDSVTRTGFRSRLPRCDDPLLGSAVELERRMVAQRDRVLADFPHPFQFLAQTQMRWTLRYADSGERITGGIPQATIHARYFRSSVDQYVPAANRTVVAETTIESPVDQDVNAWIGFTALSRSSGRAVDGPTPKRGEWNRYGAYAELNGERIPPPEWRHPGTDVRPEEMKRQSWWSFAACNELPFSDEEYFMRPPHRIHLRKGENRVRLVMPPGEQRHVNHWVGTFIPFLGTSEHPREVPGLRYR